MRFSSIFQSLPTPRRETPREQVRPPEEESAEAAAAPVRQPSVQQQQQPQPPSPAPAQELPDDLDARVRLIGEWQLGEG